ncbi:MAG: amino acid decarboxylase, partial [Melioribacteraceae bacterium]
IRLGQIFAEWIDEDPAFERLAPAPFSTICFRAKPEGINDEAGLNEFNQKLLNLINSTGKVFLTHTKLNGMFTIRVVISGLRTEETHVKLAWKIIKESLEKLLE